jgi:hypothetical protein
MGPIRPIRPVGPKVPLRNREACEEGILNPKSESQTQNPEIVCPKEAQYSAV